MSQMIVVYNLNISLDEFYLQIKDNIYVYKQDNVFCVFSSVSSAEYQVEHLTKIFPTASTYIVDSDSTIYQQAIKIHSTLNWNRFKTSNSDFVNDMGAKVQIIIKSSPFESRSVEQAEAFAQKIATIAYQKNEEPFTFIVRPWIFDAFKAMKENNSLVDKKQNPITDINIIRNKTPIKKEADKVIEVKFNLMCQDVDRLLRILNAFECSYQVNFADPRQSKLKVKNSQISNNLADKQLTTKYGQINYNQQRYNLISYDENSANLQYPLPTDRLYVFDAIQGIYNNSVYIKAFIFTSMQQIYVFYHPTIVSDNLKNILALKTTKIVAPQDLFQQINSYYQLQVVGSFIENNITTTSTFNNNIYESDSVEALVQNQDIFQKSLQILQFLKYDKIQQISQQPQIQPKFQHKTIIQPKFVNTQPIKSNKVVQAVQTPTAQPQPKVIQQPRIIPNQPSQPQLPQFTTIPQKQGKLLIENITTDILLPSQIDELELDQINQHKYSIKNTQIAAKSIQIRNFDLSNITLTASQNIEIGYCRASTLLLTSQQLQSISRKQHYIFLKLFYSEFTVLDLSGANCIEINDRNLSSCNTISKLILPKLLRNLMILNDYSKCTYDDEQPSSQIDQIVFSNYQGLRSIHLMMDKNTKLYCNEVLMSGEFFDLSKFESLVKVNFENVNCDVMLPRQLDELDISYITKQRYKILNNSIQIKEANIINFALFDVLLRI